MIEPSCAELKVWERHATDAAPVDEAAEEMSYQKTQAMGPLI